MGQESSYTGHIFAPKAEAHQRLLQLLRDQSSFRPVVGKRRGRFQKLRQACLFD
jgi:hypothetical protein